MIYIIIYIVSGLIEKRIENRSKLEHVNYVSMYKTYNNIRYGYDSINILYYELLKEIKLEIRKQKLKKIINKL